MNFLIDNNFSFFILCLILLILIYLSDIKNEIKKTNLRIELILKHLDISLYNELSENDKNMLIDLLKENKNVKAIKLYRELTGYGLKEAKDFIDKLKQELNYD